MSYNKYTKKDLKENLRNLYIEKGKIPIANEIKSPSAKTYMQYFGSWRKALNETFTKDELNYKHNVKSREKETLIDLVKTIQNRLKRDLTYNDFTPKWRDKIKKHFVSLNNLCNVAAIPKIQKNEWTKELLIQKLHEKIIEINRIPNPKEMCSPYPSYRLYYKYFDSWSNVLSCANLKEESNIFSKRYTKNELIIHLKNKYQELGRIPKSIEMKTPNISTYFNHFGSWNKALAEAGLIDKSEIDTYNKSR